MGMELELTAEQRRVVDHAGGRLRVLGAAGSGKTTALLARYRRLVTGGAPPSAVLVLCRTRVAAGRFRDVVLPDLAGGFDALPITTFFGLAYDLVSRYSAPVTLLTGAEQRHFVAHLLADEDPAAWPTLGYLRSRPAFVGEVADGLLHLQSGGADGGLGPTHGPWPELVDFAERYRRALDAGNRLDASGLLARAADLLADPAVTVAEGDRVRHVLVDDFEAATPPMAMILERLPCGDIVVAGDPDGVCGGFSGAHRRHLAAVRVDVDIDLNHRRASAAPAVVPQTPFHGAPESAGDQSAAPNAPRQFRQPGTPVLIATRHPSLEPEAVAGELLAARAAGVAWSDMAVLVRRPRHRARAIARALARHGVPAHETAQAAAGDDPVVASVVDMLRWVDGDASALDRLLVSPLSDLDAVEASRIRRQARLAGTPLDADPRLASLIALRDRLALRTITDTPADLAFQIWQQSLTHLVDAEDSTLDGLVAFIDALQRQAERDPHLDAHRGAGRHRRRRDRSRPVAGRTSPPPAWEPTRSP